MRNHQFVGRLDRLCEVCGKADRHPIHNAPLAEQCKSHEGVPVEPLVGDDGLPRHFNLDPRDQQPRRAPIELSKEAFREIVHRFEAADLGEFVQRERRVVICPRGIAFVEESVQQEVITAGLDWFRARHALYMLVQQIEGLREQIEDTRSDLKMDLTKLQASVSKLTSDTNDNFNAVADLVRKALATDPADQAAVDEINAQLEQIAQHVEAATQAAHDAVAQAAGAQPPAAPEGATRTNADGSPLGSVQTAGGQETTATTLGPADTFSTSGGGTNADQTQKDNT